MKFPFFQAAILDSGRHLESGLPEHLSVTMEIPELTPHLFISDFYRQIYGIFLFSGGHLGFWPPSWKIGADEVGSTDKINR